MSKVIYKYPIRDEHRGESFTLDLPAGADILKFDAQGEGLYIWALVNPDNADSRRKFVLMPTGMAVPYPESLKYIGTAQIRANFGGLVYHLFESFKIAD